jgi:hypothetical protein
MSDLSGKRKRRGLDPAEFRRGEVLEAKRHTGSEIRSAALANLLGQGLARGDDHLVEGTVAAVADEVEAVGSLLAESNQALGTLLGGWAARLRVAAELARRDREAAGDMSR